MNRKGQVPAGPNPAPSNAAQALIVSATFRRHSARGVPRNPSLVTLTVDPRSGRRAPRRTRTPDTTSSPERRGTVCPEQNRRLCFGTDGWSAADAEVFGSRRFCGATYGSAPREVRLKADTTSAGPAEVGYYVIAPPTPPPMSLGSDRRSRGRRKQWRGRRRLSCCRSMEATAPAPRGAAATR